MKVPLNAVKHRLSTYLKLSKGEGIVVTKNGRAVAVLHRVIDEDLEDYRFESGPLFIARIEALGIHYRKEGGTKIEDVRKDFGLSSRIRRRRI